MIVAASDNNAIGKNNQMLWHLPADLKFFKEKTSGYTIVMGRKTFEALGKPLPNRTHVIITRNKQYKPHDTVVVHSLQAAIDYCNKAQQNEVFVIGGGEIYKQAMPLVHKIYLTRVHGTFEADTYFPEVDLNEWRLTEQRKYAADEKNPLSMTFCLYVRK